MNSSGVTVDSFEISISIYHVRLIGVPPFPSSPSSFYPFFFFFKAFLVSKSLLNRSDGNRHPVLFLTLTGVLSVLTQQQCLLYKPYRVCRFFSKKLPSIHSLLMLILLSVFLSSVENMILFPLIC